MLDEALAALPEHAKAGGVRIRAGAAGGRGLASERRSRQIGFSIGASKTGGIQEAISHLNSNRLAWEPASRQNPEAKPKPRPRKQLIPPAPRSGRPEPG